MLAFHRVVPRSAARNVSSGKIPVAPASAPSAMMFLTIDAPRSLASADKGTGKTRADAKGGGLDTTELS